MGDCSGRLDTPYLDLLLTLSCISPLYCLPRRYSASCTVLGLLTSLGAPGSRCWVFSGISDLRLGQSFVLKSLYLDFRSTSLKAFYVIKTPTWCFFPPSSVVSVLPTYFCHLRNFKSTFPKAWSNILFSGTVFFFFFIFGSFRDIFNQAGI